MPALKTTAYAAISGILLSAQPALAVLSLQNFSAEKHHRFNNNPAFIGAGHDWSGVARASNGRWVTMISSTYFLTCEHVQPSIGNSVTFHTDNDPNGTTVTRTVTSLTRIGTTDLVVGKLNSSPGSTIAHYSIFSSGTSQAGFASSPYSGLTAFVTGLNNTGSGTTQFRVGRNVLDGFVDDISDDPPTTVGDAVTFTDDSNTIESLGDDEAYLIAGDSGAPLFVSSGNDLVLTGINWFNSYPDPNAPVKSSGCTFVPNYTTEINAVLADGGESLTLVTVPEPSSLLLVSLSAVSLLTRRKK